MISGIFGGRLGVPALREFEQVGSDPSTAPGLARRVGTIVQRADGSAWVKTTTAATGWTSVPRLGGLQKIDGQTVSGATVSTMAFSSVPVDAFGGLILTAAIKNAQAVEVGLRLRLNGVHTNLSAASLFAGNAVASGFASTNRGDLGALGANGTTEILIFLPFAASTLGMHRSALYYRSRLTAAGVTEYTYTGAIGYADASTVITGLDVMSETLNAIAVGSTAALWGWKL